MRTRRHLAALAATTLVAACAPDHFRASPGFDGFLERVGQVCYPDTIGGVLVRQLAQGFGPAERGHGAGFINATSSLYYGKWTPAQFRGAVTAFSDNSSATNKAIDCVVANLPPSSGGTGVPAGRDPVHPPPPAR
jgi:hypothetical protein